MYFTFLQDPRQRTSVEFLRNYGDLLKFFQYFCKELIDLKNLSKQKYVSDDVYEYINCLVEACKFNMFLGVRGIERLAFEGLNKSISKLVRHDEVKTRVESVQAVDTRPKPDGKEDPASLMSSDQQSSCYSTSESQPEKTLSDQESDFTEKVKINSAKTIAAIMRLFPKIFIDNKLWTHILPFASVLLPKTGSTSYTPQITFKADYFAQLKANYSAVAPKRKGSGKFNDFEFDLDLKKIAAIYAKGSRADICAQAEDNLTFLTNMKAKVLGELRNKGMRG